MINSEDSQSVFAQVDFNQNLNRTVRLSKPKTLARVTGTALRTILGVARTYDIHGIDISAWSGLIDWSIASTNPNLNFAIFRGLFGKIEDEQLGNNVAGANEYGIPWGAYIYFRPDKNLQTQVDTYEALLKKYNSPLPPIIDVESTGGLSKSALEGVVTKFVNRVDVAVGRTSIIYTSPYFWDTNLPRMDWPKYHMLWNAQWNLSIDAPTDLPNDWDAINNPVTWTLWQYTAKLDGTPYGTSAQIDGNRFNGSAQDFLDRMGAPIYQAEPTDPTDPPPPPPPPPSRPPEACVVNVATGVYLNMRDAPMGDIVAKTWRNCAFYVMSMDWDSYGRPWYKVGTDIWVAAYDDLVLPIWEI